jgi:hypothetical protein
VTSKTKRQALNDFTAGLLSGPVQDYVASIVLFFPTTRCAGERRSIARPR